MRRRREPRSHGATLDALRKGQAPRRKVRAASAKRALHPSHERKRPAQVATARPAFGLAETLFSVVLVGGIVVVALSAVGNAALVQRKISDRARGQLLAQELMSEVFRQPYEDPDETPVFGRESTELAASRADHDDVDDYNGWDASPPQNKDGTAKSGLTGWRRQVSVAYADASDLSLSSVSDTGIKRITATVSRDGVPMATLVAIRTRAADVSAAER